MKRASWMILLLLCGGCAGSLLIKMRPQASGADLLEAELRGRLEADVRALAMPRSTQFPEGYAHAAAFIRETLASQGYVVSGEPVPYIGPTTTREAHPNGVTLVRTVVAPGIAENLVAELPGETDEIVVLGAHYDAYGGVPGADDNASGVAAMLEVSRRLAGRRLHRTVRFYAWANEEPPYFQRAGMGSPVSAALARARGDRLSAVLVLDAVGVYSDAPGSQDYPAPFGLLFPDRADFVAVVGNPRSARLVDHVTTLLREAGSLKVSGAAVPTLVTGVDWSDHWSFWQEGYPSVLLTDMPPFRNEHYHERTDTPDTLDYDQLARFAAALAVAVEALATSP